MKNSAAGQLQLYFWLLVSAAAGLLLAGLTLPLYAHRQWLQTLWHVCRQGLQDIGGHLPVTWQALILLMVGLALARTAWHAARQVRQTHRFAHVFAGLQGPLPARLEELAAAQALTPSDVIYVDVSTPHAFCLGFWQPRIWLSAGLVSMLTDEELSAVLAHEAWHMRFRDPLRLLVARSLAAGFFFLPVMQMLAQSVDLQQETAADRAATVQLGSDLPLLCALQKLLTHPSTPGVNHLVAATAFNVTETRLKRLIYPPAKARVAWRQQLGAIGLNLSVALVLAVMGWLALQPVMEHPTVNTCTIPEAVVSVPQSQIVPFQ